MWDRGTGDVTMLRMRLYMSSFRMGNRSDRLIDLAGGTGRVAVIANAMDAATSEVRLSGVRREIDALTDLGFAAEELDLRSYFSDPDRLTIDIRRYDILWLRGGNCFVLRRALKKSRADETILDLLEEDSVVYAGYSAGPCVLGPSLEGFERVDEPGDVLTTYGDAPIWDGLGVLDYSFVPHFRSPGHPETGAMDEVVKFFDMNGTSYCTLRDGQVLTVDGGVTKLFE
jgi:dipeptidase E